MPLTRSQLQWNNQAVLKPDPSYKKSQQPPSMPPRIPSFTIFEAFLCIKKYRIIRFTQLHGVFYSCGGCITGCQLQKVTASIRAVLAPAAQTQTAQRQRWLPVPACCAFKPLPSSPAKVCVLNYHVIAPSCVFCKMRVTGYLRSACFAKCAVCCIRAAFEQVSCTRARKRTHAYAVSASPHVASQRH